MFKSGQGIPWGSFGIALFPVQDVTSQAGFHSAEAPTNSVFLRGSTLICMRQSIFLFLCQDKTISPRWLGAKTRQKVKVCIRPSSILTCAASGSVCKRAADFPVTRAG